MYRFPLFILLAASILSGCSTTAGEAPPYMLGSALNLPDGSAIGAYVRAASINDRALNHQPGPPYVGEPTEVEAGEAQVALEIVPDPDQGVIGTPRNLPPLTAHLSPERDYYTRAIRVQEGLYFYWVEDATTKRRASATKIYGPDSALTDSATTAEIISEVPDLFPLEQRVPEGQACPVLVRRLRSAWPNFDGLQAPCFTAQPGHRYVLEPAEQGLDPEDIFIYQRPAFREVQLWDKTEDKLLAEYPTLFLKALFELKHERR